MKFAYADPPYLGCGKKLYGKFHPEAAAYDDPETHRALIQRLCEEFPDGWALSLHTPSLRTILSMCPEDVRVGAWCKPNPVLLKGVRRVRAWEPVIIHGGRAPAESVWDWGRFHTEVGFLASKTHIIGSKPKAFCYWVFELLGMEPDDEFHDLFPGSGAVTRAWEAWRGQKSLPLAA